MSKEGKRGPVKVGEITEPMERGYILNLANHLDPNGNINKGVWSNLVHQSDSELCHSILIIQLDLNDYQDNG